MPSSDSRRRLLQLVGTAVAGSFAGCLGEQRPPSEAPISTASSTSTATATSTPTPTPATGTYADAPTGPKSYPERPEEVTRESALVYVRAFETARTYNILYEPNQEHVSIDCTVEFDTSDHGGQYVVAACTGWADYADETHADWGQVPALYFVRPGLTVRVGGYTTFTENCKDVFASSNPDENFASVCRGGDASFLAYNLHESLHTLSVTVEFLDETRTTTVLEEEYRLGTTDGIHQLGVTYRKGTYRVTATLMDGTTATYGWELFSKPEYSDPPVTILVTPDGGLTIRRPPLPAVL